MRLAMTLRLLVTIGGLVMVHNLYAGAAPQARMVLRWPALALGALWGFDLNLYTIAYLSDAWPAELAALRGLAVVSLAVLVTIGAARGSEQLRFRPSRKVTFQIGIAAGHRRLFRRDVCHRAVARLCRRRFCPADAIRLPDHRQRCRNAAAAVAPAARLDQGHAGQASVPAPL